ncbi:sulfatase domain-containing protein [Hirsutella rhossiliensis]|uniref:Sulfatase domain-containing protein n=1 Tax=Hirsutella rhossiliensis TaxID=111463 RepID=A0A9P8SK11_9HYPO|nr:sulfatase domain-containing protein [Hirsutella rhossiliensis]KAH0964759.1 sulfatase domain-containing protein [Hirsutella rhossiliensis]
MASLGGTLLSTRFFTRRIVLALVSRFADRRFAFAFAAVSVLAAKLVHVYAHLDAIPAPDLIQWGSSFFAQDTLFLVALRLLLDAQLHVSARWLRLAAKALASVLVGFVALTATISISFFFVAGLELHWRNIGTAGDSSAWRMLLTGLVSFVVVLASMVVLAGVVQGLCYLLAGMALDILKWPLSLLPIRRSSASYDTEYKHLPQQDADGAAEQAFAVDDSPDVGAPDAPPLPSKKVMLILYLTVGLVLLVQLVTSVFRPSESSFVFMSWTLPLLPFVDFTHSSPSLARLLATPGSESASVDWDNRTALAEPPSFPWLPMDRPLPGFEDWYGHDTKHYSGDKDPLRISNLDDQLLPALRDTLRDIDIRHVVLIKLEATRKDVFPIKKDGLIWEKLSNSFKSKSLPADAQKRFATLTTTANFLTGDYDDGFEHKDRPRRGGLNFNNAHTSSTYTLKSLTGTICGLTPLIADFNLELSNHIYQPCLPHIFEAFNALAHNDSTKAAAQDDFTTFKWKSSFMQSVTNTFDKQGALMPTMGFSKDRIITKEYLKSDSAKFGASNHTDINYFGLPEIALEEYIRDEFASAKKNNERVFLTHLTSTTHHDFGLPKGEQYVSLTDEKDLEDLSRYTNVVGYVDRWLGRVLNILESEGAANNTLVVFLGDHGLSIAEQGSVSTYANGNIGNFHVPLVISHPKLPHIDVNDAVISVQVLPTILDLLLASGSLSQSESQAARDLVRNYEGQSLIRPARLFPDDKAQGSWQFSLINPGGAMLAVRDARRPDWRLIVPIVDNTEWRFTDLALDPHETNTTVSFDFNTLYKKLVRGHSIEAAKWASEAAVVTSWLVEENTRRWRYKQG